MSLKESFSHIDLKKGKAKFLAVPAGAALLFSSVACDSTTSIKFPNCNEDPQSKSAADYVGPTKAEESQNHSVNIDGVILKPSGNGFNQVDIQSKIPDRVKLVGPDYLEFAGQSDGRYYEVRIGEADKAKRRLVQVEAYCKEELKQQIPPAIRQFQEPTPSGTATPAISPSQTPTPGASPTPRAIGQ